ncbi:hypothetical protein Phum_PHUM213220 [Pediculus humanus corporis]|uniref:Uncharacterized protein n=1 Tax=Pediculus humanus subsp. corporis TaxID=121224 RepID=E0VHM9_PEDHC|nr:uncharacterized protein Phum_PHUM213220 [Pediculus humanus corporis]EEB12915.1 hypothetical protein Phum_PHUM213220 [Pediculus humanus corporis]
MISLNDESNVNVKKDEDEEEEDEGKQESMDKSPAPVTPKMLIKALKHLRKKVFKGLFFTPREVTIEVSRLYTTVEQDLQLLLLEVSDKLICAAAAGLIGGKNDGGYYAFNLRQSGTRDETRTC